MTKIAHEDSNADFSATIFKKEWDFFVVIFNEYAISAFPLHNGRVETP